MKLIEGRDFYFENGNYVYTRRYHHDRGYCCQSKCRHCPWYFDRPKPPISVVSVVPSWTETLHEAGVKLQGRTRFCVHPQNLEVDMVGGTKSLDWARVPDADFILMDREENTREMAEESPIPLLVTHVERLEDVPAELKQLSQILENSELFAMAKRWDQALPNIPQLKEPPVLEWGRRLPNFQHILYVIWRDPWMCVSRDTFIGSMFEAMGLSVVSFEKKYPEIDLEEFDREDVLVLFSSEPYPFLKKKKDIPLKNASYAFVDGEVYSWFGIRTLKFLEELIASESSSTR